MNSDKVNLKNFGMTMSIAFFVITLLILISHKHSIVPTLIISSVFLILAFILPGALRPAHTFWMRLACVLSWINTRLILTVIFYLISTPIGLAMRLLGKDPLDRKINKNIDTYWKKKEVRVNNYERQF